MASVPKKMKLIEEDHGVDDQVEIMEQEQKEKELEILNKQEKDQANQNVKIMDPKPEEKDQAKLDIEKALADCSGKKKDKPETPAVLMDSNNNKPEKTGKKRRLELIPWKPFSLAELLKLPEEKAPIVEALDSAGGKDIVDSDKKKQ